MPIAPVDYKSLSKEELAKLLKREKASLKLSAHNDSATIRDLNIIKIKRIKALQKLLA